MRSLINLINLGRRFAKKMKRDRVDAYAAQSALFVIMSFFPFCMLLLTLIQYTPISPETIMDLLVEVLPSSFYSLIESVVSELFTSSMALLSGTAVAAIWATSKSVLAITNGLNSVRDVRENRNYFYRRFRSGIYIVCLLIGIIVAITLLLFGNRIQQMILQFIPALGRFTAVIISSRALLSISILSLVFLAMYCALPNCKMHILHQIPGATLAAAAWAILSYGFSIYFDFAGSISSIYGSLTTVVMLILWLYFCMYLLFIGAEINCYLEYPESFEMEETL